MAAPATRHRADQRRQDHDRLCQAIAGVPARQPWRAGAVCGKLTQLNTLLALRSSRLASVNSGIPDILWAVVLIGALVNIVLLWMIKTESHVHIIITGALSAFMGLVIFLIAAMDYPFRGDVSIDAAPFEQVYTMVMTPEQTAS